MANDRQPGRPTPDPQGIRDWLAERIGEASGTDPQDVDPTTPFDVYGVNSTEAVSISGEIVDRFGASLAPTALYDHPTIDALVGHLLPGTAAAAGTATTQPASGAPEQDPVCVVGMACRFPGADTPEEFWRNLSAGFDASADVPADRWDAYANYADDPDATGAAYTTKGAFVGDLAGFDASFFGISPREALRMDPQQRMLLEVAWQALENAGAAPSQLRGGNTGVFIGMMPGSQYTSLQQDRSGPSVLDDPYLGLGSASSVVAGRLSYLLDLRGPSLLLDTACSSSLVALHLAARSLRQGESDLALVGGVSAILHPDTYSQACKMRMLARDGKCKTFDADADGFLLGEGCGVVVLERLSDATARGHRVLAVIRGSAVNQDGRSNGLTAPNRAAQVDVIQQALADAELTPEQVDFVEAHGSGTLLGDAIEMGSLHEVFGPERPDDRPLVVGAVKTNVGHLVGAAGMAGLIKSVLALGHGRIPPNLHHHEPSPAIDWARCPTLLPDHLTPWPETGRPRIAGVSSFGWAGTNSHVLLEQPPQPEPTADAATWQVLPLSARTPAALAKSAENTAAHLSDNPGLSLSDVAATLRNGRSVLDHRAAVVARSVEEATEALDRFAQSGTAERQPAGQSTPVALQLPGTGELRVGTGRELYANQEAYRTAFDACADVLHPLLGLDLRDVLYPPEGDPAPATDAFGPAARQADADSPLYSRLDVGHAAVFAVDYACARLWERYGVTPAALIGYSLGEYVAACLAGVFSLPDALLLVVRRAQLVAEAPPGAMTTVATSPERLRPLLGEDVAIAASNGPLTAVVAGSVDAVEAVEQRLRDQQIAFMRIPTDRAMHSPVLAPEAARLEELVTSLTRNPPSTPYVSNVTGTWITDEQACDPGYWSRHLCGTVRFAEGVEQLAAGDATVLLEAGPGQLTSFATQILTAAGGTRGVACLPTLPGAADRRTCGELAANTLARLWTLGAAVDLEPYGLTGRTVTLPGYPFEHQHLWPAPQEPHTAATAPGRGPTPPAPLPAAGPRLYAPEWEPEAAGEGTLAGPFLVYADSTGLARSLTDRLAGEGPSVTVLAGDAYARTGPTSFVLRPGEPADQARLFAELPEHLRPRTVVHLWTVTGDTEARDVRRLQDLGFRGVIDCAAALSPLTPEGVRLLVVTDGAQSVQDTDTVHAGKATLAGPRLTVPQEYPGWACRTLDLPVRREAPGDERAAAVDHLVEELRWPGRETVVSRRGGVRRVQRYRPVAERTAPPVSVRDGGVYLITGGLGQIGLTIAEHLASRGEGVRLVLTGRRGLPPRESWEAHLSTASGSQGRSPEADQETTRIRDVLALESAGAEVLVQAVDAADPEALRTVLDTVHQRFGPVQGVVHAAGLTSADAFATMATLSPAQAEAHFAAKVYGTLALREALADEPLDFCLLMSSVSSVLGGLGFTAYAAANAFLDGFAAQHDPHRPGTWQSVNWDTWRSTVDGPGTSGIGDSLARYSFAAKDALRILDGVLGGAPRLAVVQGDLDERLRTWVSGRDPFAEPPAGAGTASPSTPDLFARPGGPPEGKDYERQLSALWGEALGIAEVGAHDNFFDLGGNSLIGMQLMNSVSKSFRVALPAVALFEAPTVTAMAAYLQERANPQAPPRVNEAAARVAPRPVAAVTVEPREEPPAVSVPTPGQNDDDIAVIGMAGRFPGAADLDQFWKMLREGTETISFFSEQELIDAGVPAELAARPDYVRARPVLDDIEMFDAEFFGYNPREAKLLDPQQRLFLECCWEALESAGYGDSTRPRPVAVFGGANISTYIRKLFEDPETAASVNEYQVVISNDKDALTTNVSYRFNLSGPSLGVQTFCSTSLVATHLAARSLLAGECDMALAGGVSVRVPDRVGHLYQEGGMETPDGHVRTFDARARGAIFGDGAAVVLLKKLSRALADGDPVAGIIKGSAVNNDGSLKVGFTAPSVRGQSEVITQALTAARVDPADITYVEAHGTATELGDPIEMAALTRAFRGVTAGNCRVGSVKTNLGHLDRAAGGTGLIKTVLSLARRQLPPSLHFTTPNPEIDFENGPFRVNTELTPWKSAGKPLRAGVNSLGMGGTNVHVVLEEAPPQRPSDRGREHQVLVLSARGEAALTAASGKLARHLRRHPELPLADVAYTLQVGRQRFEERRALVCRGTEDAVRLLEASAASEPARDYARREKQTERPVAFLFPGRGTADAGAASGPYLSEKTFQDVADHCCDVLGDALGEAVRETLTGTSDAGERDSVAETAAFVLEYALASLFASWGVRPDALYGRGTGAYAAACVAGVMPLEGALGILVERDRLGSGAREQLADWITANVVLSAPAIPCVRADNGRYLDAACATDPAYWADLSGDGGPEAAALLLSEPDRLLLEVGLADGLTTMLRAHVDCSQERAAYVCAVLPDPFDVYATTPAIHAALARIWVLGAEVDWSAYHAGEQRNRVVLPTYPFQRDRYWIDTPNRSQAAALTQAHGEQRPGARLAALPKQPAGQWLYAPGWRQLAPRPPAEDTAEGTWLLLADAFGVGAALAAEISASGGEVLLATPGEKFTRHESGAFDLDPADSAQWVELFTTLRRDGRSVDRIVHLWGVDPVPATAHGTARAEQGFYSLLALLQAMGAELEAGTAALTVVTSGAWDVTGAETVDPAKAAVSGPCTVAPLEYPGLDVRQIDVSLAGLQPGETGTGETGTGALARMIAREAAGDRDSPRTALRGRRRWAPEFNRLPALPEPVPESVLRSGGVYLITGGLGGIGLAMAQRLASSVDARLVLTGRSGLPDRSGWDALAADPAAPEDLLRRITAVRALEAEGTDVLVLPMDVADPDDVDRVVRETTEHFGRLDGVIHAAGLPGLGVMQFKTADAATEVLRPKLAGAAVLRERLADVPVDFLALFSSTAAVTGGGPGQADYCAANAAMDAEAGTGAGSGPRVVTVNWGEWQWNAWDLGLAGFDDATTAFLRQNRERIGISFDEGWTAFLKVLASGEPRLIVCSQDIVELADITARLDLAELAGRPTGTTEGPRHPRPDMPVPFVAPDTETEQAIAALWGQVLGLAEVGLDDDFFELGGNSLLGLDLVHRMRGALECDWLPPHVLYEARTVREVAHLVVSATEGTARSATNPAALRGAST